MQNAVILPYNKMCENEGYVSMQRGMYEKSNNPNNDYSIALLTGEFYKDIKVNEDIIIYIGEGKINDQQYTNNNLIFRKFIESTESLNGHHRKVKVYKKIMTGKWQDIGLYKLKSTWVDKENGRKMLSFQLC